MNMCSLCRCLPLIAAIAAMTWSCGSKHPDYEGAIYTFEDFAFYPDSIFDSDLLLYCSDNSYTIERGKEVEVGELTEVDGDELQMGGSDRLVNMLFNRVSIRAGAALSYAEAAGDDDVALTPICIYLYDALCRPYVARWELEKWLQRTQSDTLRRYQWPIMASEIGWALPAREVYYATGDYKWRNQNSAELMATLRRDRYLTFDPGLKLFRGATAAELTFRCDSLMDAASVAAIYSFGANADRVVAYDYISLKSDFASELRDSLAIALETEFWNPVKSCFSQMLYQWPWQVQLEAVDNLSQATAAVSGALSEAASSRLVRNSSVGHLQCYPFYPLSPLASPSRRRVDVTTAMWAVAAAKVRNSSAFNYAYSLLARRLVDDPSVGDLFRGVTLRSLFGISLAEDCLRIEPFIPQEFGDDHRLGCFKYRDAVLDITVSGYGDVISTVMLDDKLVDKAEISATLSGRHTLQIALAGFSKHIDGARFADPVILPYAQPPTAADSPSGLLLGDYRKYDIYIDGELMYQNADNRFEPARADTQARFYTFVPIADDSIGGMAAPAYSVLPRKGLTTINPTRLGQTGTKLFNHVAAEKHNEKSIPSPDSYIETTRYHNASLKFTYNAKTDGIYYVQMVYLDGLGIVNSGHRYAFRALTLDGNFSGLFVLPQLPRKRWTPDTKWWEFKGASLPLPVYLSEGVNRLSIDYITPEMAGAPVRTDDDANLVVPTSIRIFR